MQKIVGRAEPLKMNKNFTKGAFPLEITPDKVSGHITQYLWSERRNSYFERSHSFLLLQIMKDSIND